MQVGTIELVRSAFRGAIKRRTPPFDDEVLESLIQKVTLVIEIVLEIKSQPSIILPPATSPIRISDAAKFASKIRRNSGLNDIEPFFKLPEILEQSGVYLISVDTPAISGGCAIVDSVPIVLVPSRIEIDTLYACARQVGLLLTLPSRRRLGVECVLDTTRIDNHSQRSTYERFADHFALELLIPRGGLGVALQEVRKLLKISNRALGDIEILYLSRIFAVSFKAMARRCERLQLLPEGGASALHQFLVAKFGDAEKRAEILDLPTRPEIYLPALPHSVTLAIGKWSGKH